MAAVEHLNHSELIAMIEADVRSAQLDNDSSRADSSRTPPRRTRRLLDQLPSSSGASSTAITLSSDGSGGCENAHEITEVEKPVRHSLSTGFYSSADEQYPCRGTRRVDCVGGQPEELQVTAL